jgi:hypothetical protein
MPRQLGSGIDAAQFERIFVASLFLLSVEGVADFAMYVLIIVIAILSTATAGVTPVEAR